MLMATSSATIMKPESSVSRFICFVLFMALAKPA